MEKICPAQSSPSPTWHHHWNHHTDKQGGYARLRGRNINLQKSGSVGKGCQLGCISLSGLLGKEVKVFQGDCQFWMANFMRVQRKRNILEKITKIIWKKKIKKIQQMSLVSFKVLAIEHLWEKKKKSHLKPLKKKISISSTMQKNNRGNPVGK